jgi:hypothetical protein
VEDLVVPPGGPSGTVDPAEFSLTQIWDIGWFLDPGCQRLLDNLAASPVAFNTIRIMKVFTNGINAPSLLPEIGTTSTSMGGNVWPAGGSIDFSGTLNGLYELTSRGLIPLVVLGFFPDGIYTGVTETVSLPAPAGPISASTANFNTSDYDQILENWKTLVQSFFDELLADSRFGSGAIEQWWFEVWNEPDNSTYWNFDVLNIANNTTLSYYQQLYQATSDVVKANGYKIRLGGPTIMGPNVTGGIVTTPPATPTLMSEFVNFVTSSGVQCDFLSFHGKGEWDGCLKGTPDFQSAVDAADQTAQLAEAAGLTSITIINDEADMRAFFGIPFKPRMTEQSPAWSCAMMVAYDSLSSQYTPIRFMAGSDNGEPQLIGESWQYSGAGTSTAGSSVFAPAAFGQQRSIVTAASTWSSGCPTDLLKVPIYDFYELLRLLGDQHGTFLSGSNNYYPNNSDLFHMITVAATHIGSVFCVYPPNPGGPSNSWSLDYSIVDVPWPTINWYQFQIDATISNSFTAADGPTIELDATSCYPGRAGAAPNSSLSLPFLASAVQGIRKAQELSFAPTFARNLAIAGGVFKTTLSITPYTTTVIWITPYDATTVPATPAWATSSPVVTYTAEYGTTGTTVTNVLLRWQPDTDPAFYSYEIYRDDSDEPVSPIPLRSALWIDTDVPTGRHTYWIRTRSPSGIVSALSPSQAVTI